MKEYTEYFVAFLDILGFKNLLNNLDCREVYEIFNRPPYHMFEPEKYKKYTDMLLNLCNSKLCHVTDASLREKYLWLKDWTNKIINMHGITKEWYENERKEKREAICKEIK